MQSSLVISLTLGDALKENMLKELSNYSIPEAACFNPGLLVYTDSVESLFDGSTGIKDLLDRHLCGDFGNCGCLDTIELSDSELRHGPLETDDSGKLNKLAILGKYYTVLSEYSVNGQIVWVMTEDVNGTETRTTVMFPSEY
jgi:hypothetical protein